MYDLPVGACPVALLSLAICVGSDGEKKREMERRILALTIRDHTDNQTLHRMSDVRDMVVGMEK